MRSEFSNLSNAIRQKVRLENEYEVYNKYDIRVYLNDLLFLRLHINIQIHI